MWLCFICNVYVYIHIPSYNHLMVHITIWNILQLFNDNNTCRVSGSLGQLVPKLMTSLLNVLFIEFRVIPPNVGQKVSVSAELPKFYLGFKKRMALKFVYFLNNWNNNDKDWASLVVQWLKICLQMQGTQVLSHPGLDTKRQRQSGILFYHGMGISILLKVPAAKLISLCSRVRLCATHRWQPNRLPRPWDSPGKNTGVGCHFLLQCIKVKSEREVGQ